MEAHSKKRSIDESDETDDAFFAQLFDEGDTIGIKFQKLKGAYLTLQSECEQQKQKWDDRDKEYVDEICGRDEMIKQLKKNLLNAQNRSMNIEDLDKGIDFISTQFALVFVEMLRNKCTPGKDVLDLPRLVSYSNGNWLLDMTTWGAADVMDTGTDSPTSEIERATKVIVAILTKTLELGRAMCAEPSLAFSSTDVDAALVCTMSSFMSFMDPKFVSPLAILIQLTIKAVTGSDLANSIVGAALPGGVTSKWLYDNIASCVLSFKHETMKDDVDMGTLYVYDNKGKYKLQTYSFGMNSKYVIPVWTNRGIFRYDYKHERIIPNLYKYIEHSPMMWKSKEEIPLDLFDFASESIPIDENCLSHQIIWELHERIQWQESLDKMKANYDYVKKNYDKYDLGVVDDNGLRGTDDSNATGDDDSNDDDDDDDDDVEDYGAESAGKSKICEDCNLPNSKFSRVCKACKSKLLTLLQIKQSKPTTTKFRLRARPSAESQTKRRARKSVSIDAHTLQREIFEPVDDRGQPSNVETQSHKLHNPHDHSEVTDGDRTFAFKMLTSLMINPTGKGSLRQIYEEAAKFLRLAGFTEGEEPWRYFIELISDLGACDIALLEEERFNLIIVWLGTWHINQMWQKTVMKLLWHWGAGRIAYMMGYQSMKAQKTLFGGASNRKSRMFCRDLIYQAAKDSTTFEFLKCCENKGIDFNEVTVEDFLEWKVDTEGDLNFQNNNLLLEWLSALELSLAGTHDKGTSGMDMFYAAMLKLFPLLFGMNSKNYGPALLREISILFYRCTYELREHHRQTFTFFGKSLDEFFEERNNEQSSLLPPGAPTAVGIDYATMFMNYQSKIMATAKEATGCAIVKRNSTARTIKDMSPDYLATLECFISEGIFGKEARRSEIYQAFDQGSRVVTTTPENSFIGLSTTCNRQMAEYIPKWKDNVQGLVWPQPHHIAVGVPGATEDDRKVDNVDDDNNSDDNVDDNNDDDDDQDEDAVKKIDSKDDNDNEIDHDNDKGGGGKEDDIVVD